MGRTGRNVSASDHLVQLRADFRNATVANHADEDFWSPYESEEAYYVAVDLGGQMESGPIAPCRSHLSFTNGKSVFE
jgi:hypothetical protein